MYSRKFFIGIVVLLSFFLIFQKASAATITLQNATQQMGANDEYVVDVQLSISAADNTNYYLRGVFFLPGTSNYCGYTWNGTDWFKGPFATNGQQKQFEKVTVINHSWSGQLKAKIDPTDSGCSTSNTYSFKVERFTDTSNAGTFDTQTEQSVAVAIPTPTPTNTPVPTLTSTPTPRPTPTPKPAPARTGSSTSTPALFTPVSSQRSTAGKIGSSLPTPLAMDVDISTFGAVLGTMSAVSPTKAHTPTLIAAQADQRKTQGNFFSLLFILAGFCLLASCGILVFSLSEKGQALWKRFF